MNWLGHRSIRGHQLIRSQSAIDNYNSSIALATQGYIHLVDSLERGQLDRYLVQAGYFDQLGPVVDYDSLAIEAARVGRADQVQLLIQRGAKGLNAIAEAAAYGGYSDLVRQLIQAGASNYNGIACRAAYRGHDHLVTQMIDRVTDYNSLAKSAAMGGHFIIIDLAISYGADDYYGIAVCAAANGQLGVIERLVDRGLIDPSLVNQFLSIY